MSDYVVIIIGNKGKYNKITHIKNMPAYESNRPQYLHFYEYFIIVAAIFFSNNSQSVMMLRTDARQ